MYIICTELKESIWVFGCLFFFFVVCVLFCFLFIFGYRVNNDTKPDLKLTFHIVHIIFKFKYQFNLAKVCTPADIIVVVWGKFCKFPLFNRDQLPWSNLS